MSAEWVTAIASAGTFAVIAASAAAALTECRERLESVEFNDARRFVTHVLPMRLSDPERWREAVTIPYEGEYVSVQTVANFLESLGLFVKYGIIDKRIACDAWSGVVLGSWTRRVIRTLSNDRQTPRVSPGHQADV